MSERYIKIELLKRKNLKGFTLLECFPGFGLAGTIAGKYIANRLNMEEIGYIDTNLFSPLVRIHKGLPQHQAPIFYSKKHKLLVLIAEQPILKEDCYYFANSIVDFVLSNKISRVISLSGLKGEFDNKVFAIVDKEERKKELENYGISFLEEGLLYGVSPLVMLKLRDKNVANFALFAPTSEKFSELFDYGAAMLLIDKLNLILQLDVPLKEIAEEVRKLEESIKDQIKKIYEAKNKTREDVPETMYV